VGNVEVDLTQLVIDESAWYDLATLDLTKVDASKIRGGKEIPCQYWEAREWPPKLPAPKEFLMFGGFPLSRRKRHALDQIEFGAVSSGGTEVRTVQEDLITAQIAFDECIVAFDDVGNGFPELPGISGGPVMQLRTSNMGLELFEMIGVIFEHHEAYDSLRVRPLSLIDEQGKITKPPMQYNVVSQRRD
jgi:hypothetical protein